MNLLMSGLLPFIKKERVGYKSFKSGAECRDDMTSVRGAFMHVRGRLMGPSHEAAMYRGQNLSGATREWLFAWNTPRMNYQNRVYTEIRTSIPNWNTINNNMERNTNNHKTTALGCFSSVSIGSGSSPHLVAIMTLEGVNRNAATIASDVSAIFSSLDSKYEDDEGVEGIDEPDATPTPTSEE
ncbi:hypothetical protein CASFOL_011127 [Castilleja foliolosa]|uniref:Uncharacterized protein n=1 Tax=Castilleja foliolosa TaxID=1961234 RepID=A0ABD3DWL1_9LAMI